MITSPDPINKEIHVINSKSIMCKTDINGFIEYANDYFVELSGYNEGELMGESLKIIGHPDMPKIIIRHIWNKLKTKKKTNAIIKYLSKSGSFYWLQIKFDFKVDEITREILNVYLYATTPDINAISKIDVIYTKLVKIEKESNLDVAQNYFNGYLENLELTYETFIEKYLKSV